MLRHLDAISDYLGTILGHLEPMLSPLGSIMGSAWSGQGGGYSLLEKFQRLPNPSGQHKMTEDESNVARDRDLH